MLCAQLLVNGGRSATAFRCCGAVAVLLGGGLAWERQCCGVDVLQGDGGVSGGGCVSGRRRCCGGCWMLRDGGNCGSCGGGSYVLRVAYLFFFLLLEPAILPSPGMDVKHYFGRRDAIIYLKINTYK